jgi:hypothetical protein
LQDVLLLDVLLEELAHKLAIVLRALPHGQESGGDAGQMLGNGPFRRCNRGYESNG